MWLRLREFPAARSRNASGGPRDKPYWRACTACGQTAFAGCLQKPTCHIGDCFRHRVRRRCPYRTILRPPDRDDPRAIPTEIPQALNGTFRHKIPQGLTHQTTARSTGCPPRPRLSRPMAVLRSMQPFGQSAVTLGKAPIGPAAGHECAPRRPGRSLLGCSRVRRGNRSPARQAGRPAPAWHSPFPSS